MAFSREVYQALEDIVGPNNISDDPIILDTYSFQNAAELRTDDRSKFMPRPEAVALPATTEEVQAIVKACNRYGIKFKAHSTAWGTWAVTKVPGLMLDLKRMNRILEIDEKNMFAVIEPFVVAGTLQAEAMKVGLNTHMIGAGSLSSVLAQATSMHGAGPDSISMGYAAQNGLAMEWVTPTGDIVRTGSAGSRDGWFCGEGPGPSIRGLFRGYMGAVGGLGIFTKCGVKLYPWPGPATMEIEGTSPAYYWRLPDNFKAYALTFPTWEAFADAYYKVYDSEIGYIFHKQFGYLGNLQAACLLMFSDPTKTIDDLVWMLEDPEIKKLADEMEKSVQIVLAGNTPRDIEYQEKVLNKILADTGGHIIEKLATPEIQNYMGLYFLKMCYKGYNWVLGGGYCGTFIPPGTPDWGVPRMKDVTEIKKKYIAKGGIVDDGAHAFMGAGALLGGGGFHYLEMFTHFDPTVRESIDETRAYVAEHGAQSRREKLGVSVGAMLGFGLTKEEHEKMLKEAAHQPVCWAWQRKIKEAFDPNGVGDGSFASTD